MAAVRGAENLETNRAFLNVWFFDPILAAMNNNINFSLHTRVLLLKLPSRQLIPDKSNSN
jgi:hypothetical protein